jgi:maleate cis-trans isomerase
LAPYRDDPPDLVFHGCTAAGFLAGVQGNARVVEAIRSHVDATVVSTAQSMADVLLAHGLTRISVLTPYVQSLNLGLRAFLAESGITVARLDSFDCRTLAAMLALTAEQVFAQAVDCVAPGSQGLFLACTQMPSLDIIPRLQDRLGIPVWSAISASAWAGERARAAMT